MMRKVLLSLVVALSLHKAEVSFASLTPRAKLAEELGSHFEKQKSQRLVEPLLRILDQVSDEDLKKWADEYLSGNTSDADAIFKLEMPNHNSKVSATEMDIEKARFILQRLEWVFNQQNIPRVQRNQLYSDIRHRLHGDQSTAERIISALKGMSDEALLLFEKQHRGESHNKLPFVEETDQVWNRLGHLSRQTLKNELSNRLVGLDRERQDAMENILAAASDNQLYILQDFIQRQSPDGKLRGSPTSKSVFNNKNYSSNRLDQNKASNVLGGYKGQADEKYRNGNLISDYNSVQNNKQSEQSNILDLKDESLSEKLEVYVHPETISAGFKLEDVLQNTAHRVYAHAAPPYYQRDFKSLDFTDLSPTILQSLTSPAFLKDSQRAVAAATAGSRPYVGDLCWKPSTYPSEVCVRLFDVMKSVVVWGRKNQRSG